MQIDVDSFNKNHVMSFNIDAMDAIVNIISEQSFQVVIKITSSLTGTSVAINIILPLIKRVCPFLVNDLGA